MKQYATTVDAMNALRRLVPGIGRTFDLLPEEIERLCLSAELALFFQPKPSRMQDGEKPLPSKSDIQRTLRSEAQRILLRRSYGRSKPPTQAAADEARRVIDRVESALPAGSAARLVHDVSLGRRELRTQEDYRKYERGIPALSRVIQSALQKIYGPTTAAVFKQSIGVVAVLSASEALVRSVEPTGRVGSLHPVVNKVSEFRRHRGEKEYWDRVDRLDSLSQYVLFGLQQSSVDEVKKAFEEKYRSQSAPEGELAPNELTPARMEFNTHIRTIEEVFEFRE